MKTLIIYLSATGKTERLANEIADRLGDADLLPIALKTKIPKNEFWLNFKFGFLMGTNWGFRFGVDQIDPENYDQILIGTPVWMSRAAPPVIRVTKKLKVENKVYGLFTTCGGGPGRVFEDISKRLKLENEINRLVISEKDDYNDSHIIERIDDFVNQLRPLKVSFANSVINER